MALQVLQADELQSAFVRALQHHRWRKPCKQGLAPAGGAQTPAVAGLKSCKAPLWPGRAEVVAELQGKRQKIGRDPGADEVRARVALVGAAAAVAKVAGERVVRAWRQRRSQNVKQSHACHRGVSNSWVLIIRRSHGWLGKKAFRVRAVTDV